MKKTIRANWMDCNKPSTLPISSFRLYRSFAERYSDRVLWIELFTDILIKYRLTMSFLKNLLPTVRAQEDEELIDPQVVLREKCNGSDKHCKELRAKLDQCNDRVNSRSQTTETCTEELFDYLHALDHCISSKLFSQLK